MTETVDQPNTAPIVVNGILTIATVANVKALSAAGSVFTVPATVTVYCNGMHHVYRRGVPYLLEPAIQAALTRSNAKFNAA